MKTKYTIIISLLLAVAVQAQQFEWLSSPAINAIYNPSGIGYTSASDAQGDTFVCGYKDTPVAYNETFGHLWLLKYNASGQLLFSKTIYGNVNAYRMKVDNAGNLYITAAYVNEISIDDLNLTSSVSGVKNILLKFNNDGALLWYKSIPQSSATHFKGLAVDSNQNVYIGYDNYTNSYIEKLNSNGDQLLLITQTNVKILSSLAIDTEGNIYCAGSCADTNVSFNGSPITTTLDYNTYVVKYNPVGQFQWTQLVEDITCSEPVVAVRSPEEVYFGSELYGAYTFGTFTAEGPASGIGSDFFLARLNSAGVFQWVKEVPGTGKVHLAKRNFLTLDANGNAYLAGGTRFAIQWTPSISTQAAGFSSDILVVKYNPQGTVQWTKTAGGSSEDRSDAITVLPDGSLVLTGMVIGTANFDTLNTAPTTEGYHPFVAKINTTLLENAEHKPLEVFSVHPNPVNTFTTIQTKNYRGKAYLYSLLGQELKVITITEEETLLDTSTIPSGTYFLRLENNQQRILIKI